MKYCSECKISINEESVLCPLCKKELETTIKEGPERLYPKLEAIPSSYEFIRKLLIFISIVVCASSVFVNYVLDSSFLWYLIVITCVIYFWIAVSNVIRTNTNAAFKILFQVVCASALVTAIDYETGGHGWALSFVVPVIISFGTVSILILIFFNSTNWARYVLYQWMLAIFGFVPIVLYKTGLSKSFVASVITTVLAIISLTITIVFGDKTIKNEFKRRIHF